MEQLSRSLRDSELEDGIHSKRVFVPTLSKDLPVNELAWAMLIGTTAFTLLRVGGLAAKADGVVTTSAPRLAVTGVGWVCNNVAETVEAVVADGYAISIAWLAPGGACQTAVQVSGLGTPLQTVSVLLSQMAKPAWVSGVEPRLKRVERKLTARALIWNATTSSTIWTRQCRTTRTKKVVVILERVIRFH